MSRSNVDTPVKKQTLLYDKTHTHIIGTLEEVSIYPNLSVKPVEIQMEHVDQMKIFEKKQPSCGGTPLLSIQTS